MPLNVGWGFYPHRQRTIYANKTNKILQKPTKTAGVEPPPYIQWWNFVSYIYILAKNITLRVLCLYGLPDLDAATRRRWG